MDAELREDDQPSIGPELWRKRRGHVQSLLHQASSFVTEISAQFQSNQFHNNVLRSMSAQPDITRHFPANSGEGRKVVDILLATYNGARFLPELLDSLEAQSCRDWRLLVRDDGSSDDSLCLVEDWAERTGHIVQILRDGSVGLGACASFGQLLEASEAPYFMFCDQDDIWLPSKIADLLAAIRDSEAIQGESYPLLVHGDLRVVDAGLASRLPSFWAAQGVNRPEVRKNPARAGVLLQNMVTGCAMIGNAALRRLAVPVPGTAIMHDWWVAMIAGYLGEIHAVHTQVVLYRQHGQNTIGARSWSIPAVAGRLWHDPHAAMVRTMRWLRQSRAQTATFLDRFGAELPDATRATLTEYVGLERAGFLARKTFMFRRGIWPQSRARAIVMLLAL